MFINTTLAEGWEEQGSRMQPQLLYNRRESYGEDVEVPAFASCLTAGIDVQENPPRFELQVVAWGNAAERAVVDYRTIHGDPRRPETQELLIEALNRRYTHGLGPLLPIHGACIDTGHFTDDMYAFVRRFEGVKRLWATKGFGGRSGEPIVGKPSDKRTRNKKLLVRVYPINVDDAKGEWYGSLGLEHPGPGYVHFPVGHDAIDEEYFAQLCSEHRETKVNKAGVATHQVWVQDRERNEALDTAVMCLAAFRLLNPNVKQMLESIRIAAAAMVKPEPAPAAAAETPSPPTKPVSPELAKIRARLRRSTYLGS